MYLSFQEKECDKIIAILINVGCFLGIITFVF